MQHTSLARNNNNNKNHQKSTNAKILQWQQDVATEADSFLYAMMDDKDGIYLMTQWRSISV